MSEHHNTGIIPGMKRPVLLLILMTVALCGVMFVVIRNMDPPKPQAAVYEVFFTTPGQERTDSLDKKACQWIATTQKKLDIAAFDIDLPCVEQELTQLHKKGIPVRIVTDTDHETQEINNLKKAGLPILLDDRSAFMHNKFLVKDDEHVWTGSLNLTKNGIHRNNNNVVQIHDTQIARLYTAEFEEMFAGEFGPRSPRQSMPALFAPQGHKIEVLFSPEDPVKERILDVVRGAKQNIVFMAFAFTDDALGKLLVEKVKADVKVQGVFEKTGSKSKYSEYSRLKRAKADVRRDGNKGIMHHKVIIVDQKTVITGSYNFSKNADKSNDENVVILHDNPAAAKHFLEEFQRVYALAK